MRFVIALMCLALASWGSVALAYIPAKTLIGVDRHWASGAVTVHFTGPTTVDGHAVHDGVRNAMATWSAIDHSRVQFTSAGAVDGREPSIGNGKNEFGWVEASDSPYFIPGVPCTTATIYDTATGVVIEADTTCNAMAYQWPENLFGLYIQDDVADAESEALGALGSWLGLDASLQYGSPLYPVFGSGHVLRSLTADEFAFARQQYGDGTSLNGSISGTVRFPSGAPVPFAYVSAMGSSTSGAYGAVADVNGAYTIFEPAAGSYYVMARPMTTDPYILSSVPYRANPIANLDFAPAYFGGPSQVTMADGLALTQIDITPARTGSQPDPYEPNDAPAAGSPITLGYYQVASTHSAFDKDWYAFQSSPNTCYLFLTFLHGTSIVPARTPDSAWSRTQLALYDGAALIGRSGSKDEFHLDPGSWVAYCEGGSGRRLDLDVEQRNVVWGAGYFYAVSVVVIPDGVSLAPSVEALYPNSGWAGRDRYVWIDGAGFMPGSTVEVRPPNGAWVASTEVIATNCTSTGRCGALKALFPAAMPGPADVRVTNPNGRSVTKSAAFTYLDSASGPMRDWTPQVFGQRYGEGKAVCIGDYDDDGDDDILKARYGSLPYQLFRNDAGATFTDVAGPAGLRLDPPLYGESCSFVDVDDDGDLDAYTTNLAAWLPDGSSNELYLNQLVESGSATFVRSTPSGLGGEASRFQRDAAWADFDSDGRIDVVLAYDSFAESPPYHDAVRFLRQGAGGTFTEATSSSGLAGYVAAITSVKAADFDGNGCDDLVFFTYGGAANRLYKGDCHGHFTNATSASHIADGSPWCTGVAVADFNNDGKNDIVCGTYNAGTYPVRPRLWLNSGSASFTDRALEAGLHAVARNMDVVLPIDEDNDGLVDLYVGASENGWLDDRKDVLLRNVGGNPPVFTDVTDAASMYPTTHDGTGWCIAGVDEFYCDRDAFAGGVLDWRNDGASDVFVTGNDPDFLQRGSDFLWDNRRNVLADGSIAPSSDWLDIALQGANTKQSRVLSNRLGIGARVTVIARFNLPGGLVPTETQCLQNPLPSGVTGIAKEVIEGNQSQSSTVLHFGLGNTLPFGRKRVDCIKVMWPSGLERAYTGVLANAKAVLAEDVGRMKVINVVPNSGPNTQANPTTVTGLHFDRDVSTVPQVLFGAAPASSVTFVSEHELTVLPPLGQPPGIVSVTVVNTDGERDTLLSAYTFTGTSASVHFKDPVPSMVNVAGVIPNDPNFVATRGVERSGVVADGVTALLFEAEVGSPGQVRFELDDDDDPANAPPTGTGVGTIAVLGGGPPQTSVTVPLVALTDGRRVAHVVYTAPQNFVRTAADAALGTRPIRVRPVWIDAGSVEHPLPARSLDLHRVPVLYVHGMWGDDTTFTWPLLDDPRWISHRADYRATNAVGFDQNAGTPPRLIAELRKKANDRGIAGTRFFVVAHSMGALLFKSFVGGGGAPYARADNFFAGDVYALVAVDAPFFGSHLASFTRYVASLPSAGPYFVERMNALGWSVDQGCMSSLDPGSPDILDMPSATGTFHAITGWGGAELRAVNIELTDSSLLSVLRPVLEAFNVSFENYILKCGAGDDLVVCTESQEGGLTGGRLDAFHYVDSSAKAIHFDSICGEPAPSAAVGRLLDTPTTDATAWGLVLPAATPPAAGFAASAHSLPDDAPTESSAADGIQLSMAKQGDGVVLSWVGAASRLFKATGPALAAGACLAVFGASYTDAHELTVPTSSYYVLGSPLLCSPTGGLSIGGMSPASGSAMGGYRVTILGSGFGASPKVKIGDFFASDIVLINASTLTFRMMPGRPGPVVITVVGTGGLTAAATFTYTDPGPIPGSVAITTPVDGAVVTAGSTITVSAVGSGGFTIAGALATSRGVAADVDLDPGPGFTTSLLVPADRVGSLTVELLAKDANGNLKSAAPVTVTSVVPGSVALLRLDADPVTLLHATPERQIRIYGVYADGVRREVTHAPGILYEMDTQDPRKPNYPYNGTGVATVDANGSVTPKTTGSTICHVTYGGRNVDVVVEVAAIRPTMTLQRPGFISWPYQGPGVTYDVIRGKLSALRSSGGNYSDPAIGMICIKNDFTNVTAADAANPPIAEGFFYLMRDSTTRSYEESPFWATRSQSGTRTTEIGNAAGSCP